MEWLLMYVGPIFDFQLVMCENGTELPLCVHSAGLVVLLL